MKTESDFEVGHQVEAATPKVGDQIAIVNELKEEIHSLRLNLAQLRETRDNLIVEISMLTVQSSMLKIKT